MSVVELEASHLGSTPTFAVLDASVAGWNVGTYALERLMTVVVGSMLPVDGRVCISPRKSHSGSTVCRSKVAIFCSVEVFVVHACPRS